MIHKTQDEDKQNQKHNTENLKDDQHGPIKTQGWTQVLAKGE